MKFRNILMVTVALAGTLTVASCGSKNKQQAEAEVKTTETTVLALNVDSVLNQADSLVNKEITMEGVCTHICAHGGKKIFMMGSDDKHTIRIQAGSFGAFDKACVNSVVSVKGTLKEERIDEAYLQNWEASLKDNTAEKHGEGKAGCDSEKKARNEQGNSPEERIAAFRQQIKERAEKCGKEYLSFYFVEAESYEIK